MSTINLSHLYFIFKKKPMQPIKTVNMIHRFGQKPQTFFILRDVNDYSVKSKVYIIFFIVKV